MHSVLFSTMLYHGSRAFSSPLPRLSFNFLLTWKGANAPASDYPMPGTDDLYAVVAEIFDYLAYAGIADGLTVGRDELV